MLEQVKKPVLIVSVLYGVIAAVISILIKGVMPHFLAGLVIGIVMMNINFRLLGKTVEAYMAELTSKTILLYVLRLALYGAAGGLCFLLSLEALTGYAVGVLSICAGGIGYMLKGGRIHD